MDSTNRANMKAGLHVLIVLKKDQHSGKLTEGIVKKKNFRVRLAISQFQ
jgi:uncharacterized repeat protein (TIGR03833 family)